MAQAEIKEILNVPSDKLYKAITSYAQYPQFVEGCTQAQVTRQSDTLAQVDYKVSMIKDVSYSLKHEEDPANKTMQWSLIRSDFMKKNSGRWALKDLGSDRTEVAYQVEVEFAFPVPGLILNRLIKGQLPGMVKSFEKFAKTF